MKIADFASSHAVSGCLKPCRSVVGYFVLLMEEPCFVMLGRGAHSAFAGEGENCFTWIQCSEKLN